MTAVDLETLNRRTAIAAARAEAIRIGADPELLLDSKTLHDQVAKLDPDAPDFSAAVRDLLGAAAGRLGDARSAASPQRQQEGARQWTLEDVNRLPKTRAGAMRLQAAIDAGLLVDLGHAPHRKRSY